MSRRGASTPLVMTLHAKVYDRVSGFKVASGSGNANTIDLSRDLSAPLVREEQMRYGWANQETILDFEAAGARYKFQRRDKPVKKTLSRRGERQDVSTDKRRIRLRDV